MPLTINTNLISLNSQRALSASQSSLQTSIQRLSSGLRINSAKDDAAGLAIATRMDAQVRGMSAAVRNANDGISMVQTAEGAMGQITNALQRMRELAVQSANASNSASDQTSLDKEFGELAKEIQRVGANTSFNGKAILGADATGSMSFQIGANTAADNQISVAFTNVGGLSDISAVIGTAADAASRVAIASTDASVMTNSTITGVIAKLDSAINKINDERATMGATQSRFESVISNLQVSIENQTAARSRIMDADFATETANMSRTNILQQAGTAMIAQANQMPQQVLQLLR